MISKKNLLKKSRLYVILDKNICKPRTSRAEQGKGINLIGIFNKIKNRGVSIVQLRDKTSPKIEILKLALRIKQLINKNKIIFIINDFPDIAKIVDADGLHLGQDDLDIKEARGILGDNKIIGVSCHNLKQIISARKRKADYIAIGPVFRTSLKPKSKPIGLDILNKIDKRLKQTPIFAVGGINESNLNRVLANGIKRIAVSTAICKSTNPALAIKKLNTQLKRIR